MTIDEQIKKIDELKKYIKNELPILAQKVLVSDLIALVTNRVTQEGLDFKGSPFKPYSTTAIGAGLFSGKSRTQTAEKKIKLMSKSGLSLSYSQFRKLNNLNTDKKIFEFTGEMWTKFGIVDLSKSDNSISVKVGGRNQASQDKIDFNSSREGISIIENSVTEELIVQQTAQDWLNRQTKRILS
tara:strand:+ start:18686 stop:19237 length:552 start_codon:yes stop_codon:yes gene_type:complete